MAIPDFVFDRVWNAPPPPKVVAPPRLSDHIPVWIWRHITAEYRENILNCHRINVTDNPINFTTEIEFHCPEGLMVRLMLTYDMISHSYFSDEMETFIRAVRPPLLPVISSPCPVIGWRQWRIHAELPVFSDNGMFGLFGKRWETPLMQATCSKGHTAPYEDCRCGIYSMKSPSFLLDGPVPWKASYVNGIVVATDVIEHEFGYRAGLVRCIAITGIHPEAYGWDGIPVMTDIELGEYITALREDPSTTPYPNDLPAP